MNIIQNNGFTARKMSLVALALAALLASLYGVLYVGAVRPTEKIAGANTTPASVIASPSTASVNHPASLTNNLPPAALRTAAAQHLLGSSASHPARLRPDSVENLDTLLDAAYQAYQNGNLLLAEQHYQNALRLAPSNTDALLGLSALAQYRGDDEQTAQYFSGVLLLDPSNAIALAGMSALAVGDHRESQLKRLLLEQNNSAPLHFALGNYYAAQARWSEAQLAYFNAYQLEPDQPLLALNLAVSLEHLGLSKLAAQYYRRAIQTDTSKRADFNHAAIEQHAQQLIAENVQ